MDLSHLNLEAPTGHPPHQWTETEKTNLTAALKQVADEEGRFSIVPGAHEFAGRPPPTAEDEARLTTALDKIFPNKESKMSQVNEPVDMNEVVTKSAEAADQLIKQDGWRIVHQLHASIIDSINQTGLVVLPIMANLDDYKLILKDPVGFDQRFQTLSNDISYLMVTSKALAAKSEGKVGTPDAADVELISSLTLDYTRLQGYIEQTVHPLILILVEELEEVGVTELKIEPKVGEQNV